MRENEIDFLPLGAAGLSASPNSSPFSFEDATTIEQVLRSAGLRNVRIEPHDEQICCGGADATLRVVTRVGALGMVLREHSALAPEAVEAVRIELSKRERDGKVTLGTATWIVTATA